MLEEMRALITKHCSTLVVELEAIRDALDNLGQSNIDVTAVLAEAVERAHKIKGSSGTIGFPEISAAAAALEYCLRELVHRGGAIEADDRNRILSRYDRLDNLVRSVTPERSTLFNMQMPPNWRD